MSHADEVLTLMQSTGFTVHDGSVARNLAASDFPYAVRFSRTNDRSINNLRHTSGRLDLEWQVTSVGLTGESVRLVAEAMQDALLDVTVTVAGWVSYPVRYVSGQPMVEDRQVTLTDGRHPLYVVDHYSLAAEAA